MMLLLHSRGYGSIWRTGALAASAAVSDLLGLQSGERTLGWFCIGSPVRGRLHPPDLTGKVTSLARVVEPSMGRLPLDSSAAAPR
jgi:nitroreductase